MTVDLHIIDGLTGLDIKCDGLARKRLRNDLYRVAVCLHVIDGAAGLGIKCNGLARKRLHNNLYRAMTVDPHLNDGVAVGDDVGHDGTTLRRS